MAWRRTRQRPLHGLAVGMEPHTLSRGLRYSRFGIEGVATRFTIAGWQMVRRRGDYRHRAVVARNNAAGTRSVVAMMPAALARIAAVFD